MTKGKKAVWVTWKKQPAKMSKSRITGYQGYPEDDLVKESTDDDLVNFQGEADLDYYDGGGDDSGGY